MAGDFELKPVAARANSGIDIGTYALVSPQYRCDDGSNVQADVYVGSSSKCPSRIAKHYTTNRLHGAKRFYVIFSDGADLNAEHVRQCEAAVQSIARRQPGANVAGRSEKMRSMGSYDEGLMRVLVPQAIALLAAAGFPMTLSPTLMLEGIPFLAEEAVAPVAAEAAQVAAPTSQTDPDHLWTFTDNGDLASFNMYGRHDEDGNFVVLAGSHFRTDGDYALAPEILNRRDELLEGGYLTDMANISGRLILSKDRAFRSPAVAVKVMTKTKRETETAWRVTHDPVGHDDQHEPAD